MISQIVSITKYLERMGCRVNPSECISKRSSDVNGFKTEKLLNWSRDLLPESQDTRFWPLKLQF